VGAHSAPRNKSARYLPVIALAVVAVMAWWVLFGRGDGAPPEGGSSAATNAEQSSDPGSSTTGLQRRNATGTVETFEVFASRDPFVPLVGSKDRGSDEPSGGRGNLVRLTGVLGTGAQVDVNGVVHTVAEGDVFAENFKLLSVSGDCASMLFGDDQFTICEGEEILK